MLGLELFCQVEGVDVDRLLEVLVGELFGRQEEELLFGAEGGIEAGDLGEVVVVGESEELVAVFAVPGSDLEGRRVAIAIEGMGVEVAFVPTRLAGFPGRPDLRESDGHGEQREEGEAENPGKAHEGQFIVQRGTRYDQGL